ncbi:hypothetical protein MNBD_GAMMA22-48 [hydrothermal vent metagenome]|uniref:Uncharacterized protein n=1 Tax=hydrothermal vent metagenome TaxID=652676 RepID=A0A3B1ARL2_9ZZZZ
MFFVRLFLVLIVFTSKCLAVEIDNSFEYMIINSTSDRELTNRNSFETGLNLSSITRFSDDFIAVAKVYYKTDIIYDTSERWDYKLNKVNQTTFREVYLSYSTDNYNLKFGRQIIAWGRADSYNPTDVITPKDYTYLDDKLPGLKLGADALKLQYYFENDNSIYFIAALKEKNNFLPGRDTSTPIITKGDQNFEFGIKLDHIGSSFDGALSFYKGYDLNSKFVVDNNKVILQRPFYTMYGADFVFPIDDFGVRGEIAYINYENNESNLTSPFDNFSSSLGMEFTVFNDSMLSFQWLHKSNINFTSLNDSGALTELELLNRVFYDQLDKNYDRISMNFRISWLYSTIELDLGAIKSFNNDSYGFHGNFNYDFEKNWNIAFALDYFDGKSGSYFNYFNENNLFLILLRYKI